MDTSTTNSYTAIVEKQRDYFQSNVTKSVSHRKSTLQKLLQVLESNEGLLLDATFKDLRKSKFETITTELGILKSEINHCLQNLDSWADKEYVSTVLANIPASSYIINEPLGSVLIIGAWNYPILLTLHPLIAAIAAGNTAILKPSELSPSSSEAIAQIINSNFDANYIHVIEGGIPETTNLLALKFDKIFYTGSSAVGKIIYKAAAEHLTPVTLELGGKSPAIITKTASLKIAAKRIVWGKFLNAGQTCVAPDYLLVDQKVKAAFMEELKSQIVSIFGNDPQQSDALGRIINSKNFQRLKRFIQPEQIVFGGQTDESDLYIAPTLLGNVSWEDPVMLEEIFGPILPIMEYTDLNEAIHQIKSQPKPLALYIFTNSSKTKEKLLREISFGGGGINETIVHLGNHHLPFGGVGNSGMGNYHGKYGFDCFSHKKAIHEKPNWFEPSLKYPPFTDFKTKIIRWVLK